YGEPLRAFITKKTNPINLLNVEDTQLFSQAIVESNIILLQKKQWSGKLLAVNLKSDYQIGSSLENYFISNKNSISDLSDSGWIIGNSLEAKLKHKIEDSS